MLQSSYRSWKAWKVMKFKNWIFKALKVMECNCRSLKVMQIAGKARIIQDKEE